MYASVRSRYQVTEDFLTPRCISSETNLTVMCFLARGKVRRSSSKTLTYPSFADGNRAMDYGRAFLPGVEITRHVERVEAVSCGCARVSGREIEYKGTEMRIRLRGTM